ncbi:hypothetical protein B296_00037430 [Ensete ventricosum]|uniref:Uncharacterized protein n=1 Tax=Ensete ventricosum TaxID=4639 RepID=A0A426Z2W9_ENSVE|nr:hypothetical protein B296_00037430 [Ensete ventricosum]
MKLMYKDKERESTAFLDIAGVKDKSKVVLVEDSTAQAKRLLEMRKTDKMEKAAKAISAISLEVDRLASKVIILPPTIVYPSLSSNLHRIVILRTIDRLGVGVGWDREQGREGGGDGRDQSHRLFDERADKAGCHRRRRGREAAEENAGQINPSSRRLIVCSIRLLGD